MGCREINVKKLKLKNNPRGELVSESRVVIKQILYCTEYEW